MGIIEPNIDANLIAKYDVNGPRYTSYPTANHFSENLGVGTVVDTIKRIPVDQDLSGDYQSVNQLHFGGGTPTYLNDEQLSDVFETIRQWSSCRRSACCR